MKSWHASPFATDCCQAHFVDLTILLSQERSRPQSIHPRQPHTAKMSDSGEVEVEVPQTNAGDLPKDVTAEAGSIKLFNKWSYEDVEIRDISLTYAAPL